MLTCFEMPEYPLRDSKDIGVWNMHTPGLFHLPGPGMRPLGIAFWAIYLGLAAIALWDSNPRTRALTASKLRFCTCQCRWINQPIGSRKLLSAFARRHGARRTLARVAFQVLLHLPRYLSAVMFLGYIVFLERVHWGAPEDEAVAAVGQWSAAVQVGLVLVATLFARVVESGGTESDGERPPAGEGVVVGDFVAAEQDLCLCEGHHLHAGTSKKAASV
jgi:hypothetical protein